MSFLHHLPCPSSVLFPATPFARGVHVQLIALGLGRYSMINSELQFSNNSLEFFRTQFCTDLVQFFLNGNSPFTLRVIVWSNSCSDVHSAFKVAIRIIIHDGIFFFDSEINKNNCKKGVCA